MWRASVLTIFPDMFPGPLGMSLAGKALAGGHLVARHRSTSAISATDMSSLGRRHARGRRPGMVMKADVLARAIDAVAAR